jgi:hypothetical protein
MTGSLFLDDLREYSEYGDGCDLYYILDGEMHFLFTERSRFDMWRPENIVRQMLCTEGIVKARQDTLPNSEIQLVKHKEIRCVHLIHASVSRNFNHARLKMRSMSLKTQLGRIRSRTRVTSPTQTLHRP